ncbi:MAG: thioredoxin family protein [Parabacteroides sp.]
MEKTEKKGFWASLFSSKPTTCACKGGYVLPTEATNKIHDAASIDAKGIREIKVLGPGCSKCKSTYAVVEKVVKASGKAIRLTKVEEIEEFMRYNILSTPAIVVDGQVVMKGKIPSESEVKQMLGL